MDTTLLIRYLGDTPQLRIIDFFLDNRSDYSKKEILENTGMSKTTLYKVWPDMEQTEGSHSGKKIWQYDTIQIEQRQCNSQASNFVRLGTRQDGNGAHV